MPYSNNCNEKLENFITCHGNKEERSPLPAAMHVISISISKFIKRPLNLQSYTQR